MNMLLLFDEALRLVFFAVLWKVYGECENFMTLKGHTGPILEVAWNFDGT
jgi:hypothetical protein